MRSFLLCLLCCFVVSAVITTRTTIRKRIPSEKQILRRMQTMKIASNSTQKSFNPFHENYADDVFVGEFQIGSQNRTYNLAVYFDSADVFLASTACRTPSCLGSNGRPINLFDPDASTTYQSYNDPGVYHVAEHNQVCAGDIGSDNVNFNGYPVFLTFGLCTTYDYTPIAQQTTAGIDGAIGLGHDDQSQQETGSLLTVIFRQLEPLGYLPLFTVALQSGSLQPGSTTTGRLTFGEIDTEMCDDDRLTFVPLSSYGDWQFAFNKVSMKQYTSNSRQIVEIISDDIFINAPAAALDHIYTQTGAAYNTDYGQYTTSCYGVHPDLVFRIGNTDVTIPSSEYIIPTSQTFVCLLAFGELVGSGFSPDWQFGDPFLRSTCTVFDYGYSRIGFAPYRTQARN